MTESRIIVRDLTETDVPNIADYWLNSDKDFLTGMGVDLAKVPSRKDLTGMLMRQIQLPDNEKASLALILEADGKASGHCNVNGITFGKDATMHLHLWNSDDRKRGLGTQMVLQSLPVFFARLRLETIWCEPYAENPAPNRTLLKAGFEFVKKYVTVSGSLNFEQEVNRYRMTREKFEGLNRSRPD